MSDNNKTGEYIASDTPFIKSLKNAADEDITPCTAEWLKKRRKYLYSTVIRVIILVICSSVALSSLYSIADTLIGYQKAEEFYSDMYELFDEDIEESSMSIAKISDLPTFGSINGPKGSSTAAYNNAYARMKSRILKIKDKCPDVYGWIIIPGTENIDYPVLQTDNNEYYLNHVYSGNYLQAGSIFADFRCSKDTNENFNTVLYGHNMQNGMMFSELMKYFDEDFFNENQYIYLCTETGIYTYRIFSSFKADYRSGYVETGFPSGEDFVKFAEEMQSRSLYKREGISFDEGSRIITLSTCTNSVWTERYCVQGLLVDAYNDN